MRLPGTPFTYRKSCSEESSQVLPSTTPGFGTGPPGLQAHPAVSPSARFSHSMIYDSAHQRMFLFAGHNSFSSHFFTDTWASDGTFWNEFPVTPNPDERVVASVAYDSTHVNAWCSSADQALRAIPLSSMAPGNSMAPRGRTRHQQTSR